MWVLLKLLKSSQYSMDGHCVTRPSFQLKNLKVNTCSEKWVCGTQWRTQSKIEDCKGNEWNQTVKYLFSRTHQSLPVCAGRKATALSVGFLSFTTLMTFYFLLGIHLTFLFCLIGLDLLPWIQAVGYDYCLETCQFKRERIQYPDIHIFLNCYGCGSPGLFLRYLLTFLILFFSLSNWKRSIFVFSFASLISASWERIVLFFTNRFVCIANN